MAVTPDAGADLGRARRLLNVTLWLTLIYQYTALVTLDRPAERWLVAGLLPVSFALTLRHVLKGRAGERPRWWVWTLTAQGLVAFVPSLVVDSPGMPGHSWLGACVLLLVPGRAAWLLYVALIGAVGVVQIVHPQFWYLGAWRTLSMFSGVVAIYGMARLVDHAIILHDTRTDLARTAVDSERLRAERELQGRLGHALSTIARRARRASKLAGTEREEASAELTAIVTRAREALAYARSQFGPQQPPPAASPPGVAHRLSIVIMVAYHLGFGIDSVLDLVVLGADPVKIALAVPLLVTALFLQLRHSLAYAPGRRPRAWGWSLGAQTALSLAFVPFFGYSWLQTIALLAGTVLLTIAPPVSRILVGALMALDGGLAWHYFGLEGVPMYTLYPMALGLNVYGLSWLVWVGRQVNDARAELARQAVALERWRISRDTHDLLGLGLSAITLKTELASRLLSIDHDRARAEMREVAEAAGRALADLRSVSGEQVDLSLQAEVRSALSILRAADVAAEATVSRQPLPAPLDAMLATVLREAVTNVLRHSKAECCAIVVTCEDGVVRLSVTNDGVSSAVPKARDRGLANLRARVTTLGGHFEAGPTDDRRFALTAEVPHPRDRSFSAEVPQP
ncbi:histidine kinase [Nonomuraea sp. NPDC049152]|uniref:sensor histidine kinase n=1 Tax=Nonomuraea sp. NPDC049152 TaxID=3154350 RepID=UPI0033FDDE89